MPPKLTKAKSKRKMGLWEIAEDRLDAGHTHEMKQKRDSGQISCAECSRLKIKCDKQIPCQSCQRRGCVALCPNDISLVAGQHQHLRHRVAKMSDRVRELEDALGDLQGQHSTELHPLLCNHHNDNSDEEIPPDKSGAAGHPPELLDAFGTLSITDHGISHFFGPSGGSECLLMQEGPGSLPPNSASGLGTSQLQQDIDIRFFSETFPFTPMGSTGMVRDLIESYLPSWERASYLSQTYSDLAACLFHYVSKDQIINELLPQYYSNPQLEGTSDNKSVHELALLFLIFAVGALVDVVQETSNAEAEHYYQIARASISLQSVLDKPSLVTIQVLLMVSMYNAMSGNELSGNETSMETTWSLIMLAVHLAQTIGLHRDSARWGLRDTIVQRHRTLLWALFVSDAWGSLSTGRPPCFSLAYIDCRYPERKNVSDQTDAETASFESWNYRFAAECVAKVAARILTAEIPSYATIMDLDCKVREFRIPEEAENIAHPLISHIPTKPLEGLSLPESIGHFVIAYSREVILLYIHRCFFAQAIIENPMDPLKSRYAPSFLATYEASSIILRVIRAYYSNYPQFCARFWTAWTFAFSAAIVFGTIATRMPKSPLSSNAIKELDEACVLFTKAACHSHRAAKALPILTKLSEKAHNALVATQNDKSSPSPSSSSQLGQQWSFREGADVDELAIFSGRTRFASTRQLPAESKQTQMPTLSEPASLHGAQGAVSSFECWAAATEEQIQQQYSFQHAPAHPSLLPPLAAEYVDVDIEQDQHQQYATSGCPHFSLESLRQPQTQLPSHAPAPAPAPTSHHQLQHMHHSTHEYEASMTMASYQWAPSSSGMSNHSEGGEGYGTSDGGYAGHYNVHVHAHEHAYESLHTNTYQPPALPPQQYAPLELADLGLVDQASRLDERWMSFMHDSGYFEGFG